MATFTLTSGVDKTVTLADDAPGTATVTATTIATVRALSGRGQALLFPTEGLPVAPNDVFSDTDTSDTAGDFTAIINWSDGQTTTGTVSGGNGTFRVTGGDHIFVDEGFRGVSVTLIHTSDQLQASQSQLFTVQEGDFLTGQGTSFTATAHQAFAGTVATFSDTDIFTGSDDLVAAIHWGDGTATTGTVSGGNGTFTVSGAHTYIAAGNDTVTVTLSEDAAGPATATATTTATVTGGSIPFDLNGDTISDLVFQNNGEPAIWLWNGTALTAAVGLANPGPSWHIITSRDLNGDGNADLIWQNSDGTPGVWLMNGTTLISAAGLPNPGTFWHLVASGDLNGDGRSDLLWQGNDGTLAVWLMNGSSLLAAAGVGNPGANWKVIGAADYNGDNRDDILLQNTATGNLMIDLMNGTTVASTVSIVVGDPSWHAVSTGEFNGQAEIAWQNSNGTPAIWLMNGTTPVGVAALSNPGPGWQLVSMDHFTPDGRADLLFQNTSGALGLWEMNGTSIAAAVNLPNPGAGWQSVNGHPFAAG